MYFFFIYLGGIADAASHDLGARQMCLDEAIYNTVLHSQLNSTLQAIS